MKYLIPVALTLALSGCFAEVLTTTAITGQLQAEQAGAMKRQVQGAAENTGQINLKRAIDTYYAENAKYPAALSDLVPNYLPAIPTHADGRPYGYDPATGRISDHAVNGDQATMQAIRQAINAYGTQVGYYPPTLDTLYPNYLPVLPRTASGEQFTYNNQNGAVGVPGQGGVAPQPAQGGGTSGVGGGGLMGETMTGIGMQQQLNNANQSGANSFGTRGRSGVRDISGQHNQQQENALDALGL